MGRKMVLTFATRTIFIKTAVVFPYVEEMTTAKNEFSIYPFQLTVLEVLGCRLTKISGTFFTMKQANIRVKPRKLRTV